MYILSPLEAKIQNYYYFAHLIWLGVKLSRYSSEFLLCLTHLMIQLFVVKEKLLQIA